jgi:hypothetical protein
MTSPIFLSTASVADIKTMVSTGKVDTTLAIERVDAVLSRKTLTDSKRSRWTRLREWLVKQQAEVINVLNA